MQDLILTAIIASEKCALMPDPSKIMTNHWSAKSKSRALGHSECLKTMSRTITMQGFTLAAITASKKCILMQDLT